MTAPKFNPDQLNCWAGCGRVATTTRNVTPTDTVGLCEEHAQKFDADVSPVLARLRLVIEQELNRPLAAGE